MTSFCCIEICVSFKGSSFITYTHLLFHFLILIEWRRQWHPTPVLLPGKSHGWRSLVGCSPWGCWGSDMTERLPLHCSLSCTGEGNGNPLQCSCLESPRDGGAWWAAVYGVARSRTRLKWLSSSILIERILKWHFAEQEHFFDGLNIPGHGKGGGTGEDRWFSWQEKDDATLNI